MNREDELVVLAQAGVAMESEIDDLLIMTRKRLFMSIARQAMAHRIRGAEIEDAVQIAMIRLWFGLRRYDSGKGSWGAYAEAAARSAVAEIRRRRVREFAVYQALSFLGCDLDSLSCPAGVDPAAWDAQIQRWKAAGILVDIGMIGNLKAALQKRRRRMERKGGRR